jgi:C_GCAxxG_C_C family probable redox protein
MADTDRLQKKAADIFNSGLNCSQASLLALSEEWGRQVDARIASCFGGGIGRTGAHCGILTGSLMALGLIAGTLDAGDKARKEAIYPLARRFMDAFRQIAGTLDCRDLVGTDPSTPEGQADISRRNVKGAICVPLMEKTMALMAEFVEKEGLRP